MARVGLLALLVVVACRRPDELRLVLPALTEAEIADRARDDYLRCCAPCHGTDGRGSGASATPGAAMRPDLTRLAERLGPQFSHQYVVDVLSGERDVVAHRRHSMPVWQYRFGSVDSGAEATAALWAQRRLDALATYVESLQLKGPPG